LIKKGERVLEKEMEQGHHFGTGKSCHSSKLFWWVCHCMCVL